MRWLFRDKWFVVLLLLVVPLLLWGAITQQDKFTIPIYSWRGIDSDEPFASDLTSPIDMMNFEVGTEGGQTYIQQRKGSKRVFGDPALTEIRAVALSQLNGDTERVVIHVNGKVFFNTGVDNLDSSWHDFSGGRTITDGPNTAILTFNDAVIATGTDVIITATKAAGGLVIDSIYDWPYRRILVHNDRIYGYGVDDSTNTKIHWRPEFDLEFDSVDAKVNSGFVYVDRDDGDILTNVLSLGSHLVAYKTRAVYKVLVSPTSNYPVEIIKVADNIGAYGYGSAIQWNNIHFFVAENGVYQFDGTAVQKISKDIDFWFADSLVHSTGTAKVFKLAVVDNRLFVTLPLQGASGSESSVKDYRTFVYDLDLRTWWKHKLTPVTPALAAAESHFMLRYEYSGRASEPLLGSIHLKQRLLYVRDSSSGNHDVFHMHPADDYMSDGGTVFNAHYVTALSPLSELWQRKQFERVLTYSSALASDVFVIKWYGDADTVLDSTLITTTSSAALDNKRLQDDVFGSLLKYRIDVYDSLRVKINAMEIRGKMRGEAYDPG